MSCCGKHGDKARGIDRPERILPDTECVMCGDKHLSTAYALARETGYMVEDRARIVGELVLASWHVWPFAPELARMLRDIRHMVQARRDADVDWTPSLRMMAALVENELEKTK